MRFFRNIIGGLWLLFVAGQYLELQTYYVDVLARWGWLLGVIMLWVAVFALIWQIQKARGKKELTIRPISTVLMMLGLTWMMGVSLFFLFNPAVLTAPQQIFFYNENTEFGVVRLGIEVLVPEQDIIRQGRIVNDWDQSKETFPEQVQELFTSLSVPVFGWNLALTLLTLTGVFLLFTVFFHNLGATVRRLKIINTVNFLESTGIGMVLTMAVMFLLGWMGLMNSTAVWIAVILLFFAGIPSMPRFAKWIWNSKVTLPFKEIKWWTPPTLIAFGITMSLNLIDSVKPFPIGFDSMSLYHNTPNLLTQYEHLISGIFSYNYELITSLGHFLFYSPQVGLWLTILGALLAFGLFFELLRKRLPWQESLLLVALLSSIPMVNFFMHFDLKTDMPLAFFSLLVVHSVIRWVQYKTNKNLMMIGLWCGIAFGIKYTSALLIATVFGFLAYTVLGVSGFIAIGFLFLATVSFRGIPILESFSSSINMVIEIGFLILGLLALIYGLMKQKVQLKNLKPFFIVGLVCFMTFMPWMLKNAIETESFSIHNMLLGESTEITIQSDDWDIDTSTCESVKSFDDLDRYSDHYAGHSAFQPLAIIWNSTINPSLPNYRIRDISFLFLGFIIFVVLSWPEIKKGDNVVKAVTMATLFYGVLWLLIGQGIPWYGFMLGFGLLFIYQHAWRLEKWPYIVIGIWLVMSLGLRYADSLTKVESLLYAGGVTDYDTYIEQTVPGVDEMAALINSEESMDNNVYFIGSFYQYFVEKNDSRLYKDAFLETFSCYFQSEDPQVTLSRLREMNFEYIIYTESALRTEAEPYGPLHLVFQEFVGFADNYLETVVYRRSATLYRVPDES